MSLTFGACASPPVDHLTSTIGLADELVAQLEQRAELRNVKILVEEFLPCERFEDGSYLPVVDVDMATQHQLEAIRLRHAIMGALVPQVPVIEPAMGPVVRIQESGIRKTLDRFEAAKELGATAILTGNFAMEDTDRGEGILLFLRLVSVEDRVILAATEGLLDHPKTLGEHQEED
ncbi:MAG: hypothetical protein COA70_11800 [Planctomycetota bacterium]|nr:MAG: hypothetical protein COA70_11800 [Planctomycetota bacterium]